MNFIPLLVAAALLCGSAHAQTTPSTQPSTLTGAQRISVALALEQALDQLRLESMASIRQQMNLTLRELSEAGVPDSVLKQFEPRVAQMGKRVGEAWSTKEAVNLFLTALSTRLSERDLAEAEAFYETPAGKRTHAALQASMNEVNKYVDSRTNDALQAETKELFRAVRQISGNAP